MISPHAIIAGKTALKGAVVFVAAEAVAYEVTPEKFISLVTLAVAAITAFGVCGATILGFINRNKLQDIHIAIDGRFGELLAATKSAAKAEGVGEGRKQVHDEATATMVAKAGEMRDDKIVDGMVERIGEAADKAANTVPAVKT